MSLEIKVQNIVSNFEGTSSDEFLEILEQIMLEFASYSSYRVSHIEVS